MSRFTADLNWDISNLVERQHYMELEDMAHMAIKIEKQLKRKGGQRPNSTTGSSWKSNVVKREEKPTVIKPKVELKQGTTNKGLQGKTKQPSFSHNRDIVCFKCQGRDIFRVNVQFKELCYYLTMGRWKPREKKVTLILCHH